jgi:hypothetical protein
VPNFVPTGNPHGLRSVAALDPVSVESIATYSKSLCPPSKSSKSCVSNVGSPFKAWVAGSNPAALTKISRYLEDFGRVDFGHPRTPGTVSTQLAQRFALLISRGISPEALSGRPSCVLSVGPSLSRTESRKNKTNCCDKRCPCAEVDPCRKGTQLRWPQPQVSTRSL